jgi:hypothetical protein
MLLSPSTKLHSYGVPESHISLSAINIGSLTGPKICSRQSGIHAPPAGLGSIELIPHLF